MSKITVLTFLLGAGDCGPAAPQFSEAITLAGTEVSAERLNQGHDLYRRFCASCHGIDGAGDGPAARDLATKPRDFRLGQFTNDAGSALPTHAKMIELIRTGRPENGMPTWRGMNEDDLDALARYVETFAPGWRI